MGVLVFYLGTRLYGIEEYPIFFFCDEAVQANIAENLVERGFRDQAGRLFPAFFLNVDQYSLGFTVWIYALPVTVFGKSVLVVRATSACIGVLGVASLMLALKWFFAAHQWWVGGLVMAALPAWFIHSRTGFETAFMVSFYATFVFAYLLYREVSPRWGILAVVCGAATFYSYANGQGVMLISAVFLLFTDWRYHLSVIRGHRHAFAGAVLTFVLVSAPYFQFRFVYEPEMPRKQLEVVRSYWVQHRPLTEKVAIFGKAYVRGLSPGYWFSIDNADLVRHRIPGEAHLPLWLAPPIALGFAICFRRARSSAPCRLALIALLAAPFSASLVEIQITRVLAGILPATLFAVIGFDVLWLWSRRWVPDPVFGSVVGIGLVSAASAMTAQAVAAGGTNYNDFGLSGTQWGARQVFDRIRDRMASDPGERFAISYFWANNPRAFGKFFLNPPERDRIWWFLPDHLVATKLEEVNSSTVFVMSPEDYRDALERPELEVDVPLEILRFPNGEPGFYFVNLAYSDRATEFIEKRQNPRKGLVEDEVTNFGERWKVLRPELDAGVIDDAFDGDLTTLARTLDARVTIVAIKFPRPRSVDGVRLHLWYGDYELRLRAVRANGEVVEVVGSGSSPVELKSMELRYPKTVLDVAFAEVTVTKQHDGHVHLREIEILPVRAQLPSEAEN